MSNGREEYGTPNDALWSWCPACGRWMPIVELLRHWLLVAEAHEVKV